MNFIAGILLVFMDDELAFWSLVQMISPHASLPNYGMDTASYYAESMIGLRRDLRVRTFWECACLFLFVWRKDKGRRDNMFVCLCVVVIIFICVLLCFGLCAIFLSSID